MQRNGHIGPEEGPAILLPVGGQGDVLLERHEADDGQQQAGQRLRSQQDGQEKGDDPAPGANAQQDLAARRMAGRYPPAGDEITGGEHADHQDNTVIEWIHEGALLVPSGLFVVLWLTKTN